MASVYLVYRNWDWLWITPSSLTCFGICWSAAHCISTKYLYCMHDICVHILEPLDCNRVTCVWLISTVCVFVWGSSRRWWCAVCTCGWVSGVLVKLMVRDPSALSLWERGTVWAVQPHILSSWGISLLVQRVAGCNHNCIHCSDCADKASIHLGLAREEFELSNLTHVYART